MSYKEVQKRKNLTSRVLQIQVNRFVKNISNQIIMPSRPIRAIVNKNGFIEVLNGAKKSNDSETLESIMPKEVDLSIRQNGGFSVFLWLHTKKARGGKAIYYIFKKGGTVDQFTPSIGLSNNQTNLLIELSTSKSKKETLFANKKIEDNHLYSIGISFAINYEEDSTEVSLYIDGKLDTQSSIPGEPIHNQGSVFFGRPDSSTHGFRGTVADVMMVPSTITEKEVALAHSEGLKNLYDSNGATLGMNNVFGEIFKRKKLINKYAYYTKKSVYEIENLCLSNSKMLEIVKNYDREEKENDIRPPPEIRNYKQEKMNHEMENFLSDIDNRILCNKIDMNGQLINTCFFLANQGEEMLELDRAIKIFDTLKEVLLFTVERKFLEFLAKILDAIFDDKENNTQYLKTKTFFINLQIALDNLDLNEKKIEEENAKFLKGKKKGQQQRNILSCLRRTKPENSEPLPLEETRGFGNCIPEHEVLLLKTQNIKNSIDIEQEENLPQYHSTFIIKTLYEKPKNLPGEDPENPETKILSTSISSIDSDDLENDEKNIVNNTNNTLGTESVQNSHTNNTIKNTKLSNKDKIKQKNINDVHEFIDEIINSYDFKIKTPELGCILDDEMAKKVQNDIMEAKKEEEKKREEEENKKLSEGDNKNQNKEEKKKEVNEIVQYSFDPSVPEGWSNGNFELIINHCYNCHLHQKTTRNHYEFTFVEKFNQIGEAVKNQFPNAVVIGNLDEQEYLSNFDVYLRHTGLPCDSNGRYVVYCKRDTKQFPSVTDIVDKLICLSIMYGSSMNVEKAQFEDLKADMSKSKNCHEHPATLSEKAEKIKQKVTSKKPETKIDPERTRFYCLNNGCNKEFVQNHNGSHSCHYHPGVYQFGSYNGYWPECWTCCEGKWNAPGCKEGKHKGVLLENRIMLCVNHGEPSEDGHPDSACGTWFTSRSIDGCKFHSGHLEKGIYTCCQGGKDSPGCQEGQHRTATFPEPEAKLYFYPKILNNPGLKYDKKEVLPTVADQIKACGYFKQIQEYPDIEKIYKNRKDKEEREKEMDRICFNVGCKKIYKEANNEDRSCKCHPGLWDFGGNGSGIKMDDIFHKYHNPVDDKIQLDNIWKPHWTCCGGDWRSKPCTRCRHHGPLKKDEEKYEARFKYPDVRYKLNFKRIVGDKWASYIENYQISEARMRKISETWPSSIRVDDLPKICDKLHMNYLILQEDPSYAMKYWDIIEKSNSIEYFSKEGQVDKEKFIKWWFTDYLTIYNELHPPVKKEDKNKKEEQKNNS